MDSGSENVCSAEHPMTISCQVTTIIVYLIDETVHLGSSLTRTTAVKEGGIGMGMDKKYWKGVAYGVIKSRFDTLACQVLRRMWLEDETESAGSGSCIKLRYPQTQSPFRFTKKKDFASGITS